MSNINYSAQPNVVNGLQALMSYNQGSQVAEQNKQKQALQQVAPLIQAGRTQDAIGMLLGSGNLEGARTIANMELAKQQQAQQMAYQNANLGLQERQFGLQQQEANRKANAVSFETIKNPDGTETTVQVQGGRVTPYAAPAGSSPPQQGNPYATGKFNETQGKAASFSDRMANSERILQDYDVKGTQIGERLKSSPWLGGGYFNSEGYKKYDQAQRDFINAVLRRESGAAISPSEFDNAEKQYFPVPGDSKEIIAQKRANRRTVLEGFARESGPAYRPNFEYKDVGSGEDKQTRISNRAPVDPLSAARDAIAKGAPRDAVIQRLQQNGIDPSGL